MYQVNLIGGITGEGRAEFLRTWGSVLIKRERGWGVGGVGGGSSICAFKL